MKAHPSEAEIELYAQAQLEPHDLLRVDDHLIGCEPCRLRAVASKGVGRRLGSSAVAIRRHLAVPREPRTQVSNVLDMPSRRPLGERVGRWGTLSAAAAAVVIVANIVGAPHRPVARLSSTPTASASAVGSVQPANGLSNSGRAIGARADALTPAEHDRVESMLAVGRIVRPQVLDVLRPTTNGPATEDAVPQTKLSVTGPVGVVVDDAVPLFTWNALGPNVEYKVSVFDDEFGVIAESGWQTDVQWTIDMPLARGKSYLWQVAARTDGTEAMAPVPPQARFMVASDEQHARLSDLRKRSGDSHVALALLLAEAGVLDEAQRELEMARSADPSSSSVRQAQASISAMR